VTRLPIPVIARRAAVVALAVIPILLTAFVTSRARATPSTSATADAWSNEQAQTGSSNIFVSTSFHGGGGSASGSASAGVGTTAGSGQMSGCAIAFPPDGQICNSGGGHSSFSDQVTVVSDAPAGSPITVHVTFQCSGSLDGTGAYDYTSSCAVFNTGISGANGSSGGIIVTVSNQAISTSGSVDFGFTTGNSFPVGAASAVGVANRCCSGGAEQSWSMTLSLETLVTMTVPTLPSGATYVHFIGSDGHDYGSAPASVGGPVSMLEGLSSPSPNPTIGSSRLDLTLLRARSVDVGVYDVAGRRVATLARGVMEAGTHPLVWDGRDVSGAIARGGMYLVRARGEGIEATRRILRLR
jgi:hypothetical protein